MVPSDSTFMLLALGTRGSPGIVITSPVRTTTNSAPAASLTLRTGSVWPGGAPAGLLVYWRPLHYLAKEKSAADIISTLATCRRASGCSVGAEGVLVLRHAHLGWVGGDLALSAAAEARGASLAHAMSGFDGDGRFEPAGGHGRPRSNASGLSAAHWFSMMRLDTCRTVEVTECSKS